jgi:hypothetical protein
MMKPYLPEPALYMIRYHSFYAAHREGEYDHLMTDHDRTMFAWVLRLGPRLQPLRPLQQIPHAAQAKRTAAVLRGSDRHVFAEGVGVLTQHKPRKM